MSSANSYLFGFVFGLGGGVVVGWCLGLARMTPSRKKNGGPRE